MADRTCARCGKTFKYPAHLRDHKRRKTPCAPIVEKAELTESDREKANSCRYCGRMFASETSMYRHIRENCKIAGSDEGMAKLMEHTLQRQLAEQTAKVDALQTQMAELTAMLKAQLVGVPPPALASTTHIGVQNTGPVRVTQTVNNVNVTLVPWDDEKRIRVPLDAIRAAFTENPRLVEYCRLDDNARTDAERASPYVTEALVDLTRRAHADPVSRNVYLNPKRADQVLVCLKTGSWEVRPLAEASRLLFDGVASSIHRAVRTDGERHQLPPDVQNAAAWVPIMYEDEPDKYVKEARGPLAAHLENTRPPPDANVKTLASGIPGASDPPIG